MEMSLFAYRCVYIRYPVAAIWLFTPFPSSVLVLLGLKRCLVSIYGSVIDFSQTSLLLGKSLTFQNWLPVISKSHLSCVHVALVIPRCWLFNRSSGPKML